MTRSPRKQKETLTGGLLAALLIRKYCSECSGRGYTMRLVDGKFPVFADCNCWPAPPASQQWGTRACEYEG